MKLALNDSGKFQNKGIGAGSHAKTARNDQHKLVKIVGLASKNVVFAQFGLKSGIKAFQRHKALNGMQLPHTVLRIQNQRFFAQKRNSLRFWRPLLLLYHKKRKKSKAFLDFYGFFSPNRLDSGREYG